MAAALDICEGLGVWRQQEPAPVIEQHPAGATAEKVAHAVLGSVVQPLDHPHAAGLGDRQALPLRVHAGIQAAVLVPLLPCASLLRGSCTAARVAA